MGITLGNFVVAMLLMTLFFGSISILFSIVFGGLGTTVMVLMASTVLIVLMFIIPFLVGVRSRFDFNKQDRHELSSTQTVNKKGERMYLFAADQLGISKIDDYVAEGNSSKYRYSAYFNLGNQLTDAFALFSKDEKRDLYDLEDFLTAKQMSYRGNDETVADLHTLMLPNYDLINSNGQIPGQ
ncbi:unnamed protein product [Didymodactylos carnosus]|uniref:Uncharacterized protein n=1 Tax=Didymodactylos carnosus TaxID=1234261 RepID=A0A8S2GZN3_9BILA|nr:unnamed protein product [Didymodactylos carnosus]CAF3581323.1 unnamed protein product [Didymodactylos carnosus]